MKKFLLAAIILVALSFTNQTQAQVRLSINIGSQPAWGPTGYDHVDYYYLPDIDMYYYVPTHQYVYFDGGRWMRTTILPYRFRNFDFYHSYKVVLNGAERPWMHADEYRVKYAEFKGRRMDEHIYNTHDNRYDHYYRGNTKTQPAPPVRERQEGFGHDYRDVHHDNMNH